MTRNGTEEEQETNTQMPLQDFLRMMIYMEDILEGINIFLGGLAE